MPDAGHSSPTSANLRALEKLWQFLLGLALVLLAVFACVSKGATRFYTWPWVFYGECLLLAPLLLLGFRLVVRPAVRPACAAALPLLAVAASTGVSALLSLRPRFSFEVVLLVWAGLALAALVAGAISRDLLRTESPAGSSARFVRLVGLLFILPLLASLMLWAGDLGPVAARLGWAYFLAWVPEVRNPHPAGHWNYTGGLALLALPWLATLAWTERGRWRALWVAATGLGVVVLLSAASRGTNLGAFAAIALAAATLLLQRGLSWRRALLLAAAALAAGALLVVVNPRIRAFATGTGGRFQPDEGDVQRLAMLQGGWRLGLARPWIGHGAGMTPFVYPTVRAQLVGGVETSFQLHNALLQWWVDHGLLGVIAGGWLAGVLVAGARRWQGLPPGHALRPFAFASACTLAGYSVLACTDYQLGVIAITAAIGLHLGVLLAVFWSKDTSGTSAPAWIAGAGLLAAVAGAAFLLFPAWQARELFWSAWWTIDPADRPALVARLREAADAAPWNPHYRNYLAFQIAGTNAFLDATPAERAQAREEFARSLAIDPAQEPIHAALGWLWLADDPRSALDHFRAALALLPDRATLHLGLAFAELRLGDQAAAVRSLAAECVVGPDFVASLLWAEEPLAPLRPAVLAEADRMFAQALDHPATPRWRQPALRYARAFVRWWAGGTAPTADELAGASREQQIFFAALPAFDAPGQPLPTGLPLTLAALRDCLADPTTADARLAREPGLSPDARNGALDRLARPPDSLAGLLRSSVAGSRGRFRQVVARGHFAIMQRNLDGPGYPDLWPRPGDAFTNTFAGFLFPLHGLVPAPVLVNLTADSPAPR